MSMKMALIKKTKKILIIREAFGFENSRLNEKIIIKN